MTELPSRVLGPALGGRGVLAEGAPADLTVFDPDRIRGNATVESPNRASSGISLVLVGGRIAYQDCRVTGWNGRPIRCGS